MQGLNDPTVLLAFGQRVLLSHGDALCLGDTAYQQFRAEVRGRPWQEAFLAKSLAERKALARRMRDASENIKRSHLPADWIDLDAPACLQWLAHAQADCLIHGHTHRPATHALSSNAQRWVLSDWDPRRPARVGARRGAGLECRGAAARQPCRPLMWPGSAWREWREARVLRRRAIAEPLWRLTLARYPFLQLRDPTDQALLRRLSTLFLAEKEFHGIDGFEVSDEVAVAVAAQACLLVLHLGLERYRGVKGIVMHADQVLARREVMDEDGLVHEYDEVLSGEAMEGGR